MHQHNRSCSILCDCSVFDHLIQFQTCNNTGYITCFINICEIVVHIESPLDAA